MLRRMCAAASAVVLVSASWSPARAAASDPFAAAVPQRDTAAPEGLRAAGGDQTVAETSGSAGYAWPIEIPPGRNGVQPALALTYSSAGALRGGIAVGFTLDLPTIERDATTTEVAYRLRGLGSDQRLIEVTGDGDPGAHGQSYRPELDQGFSRVALSPTYPANQRVWTVRTPDGRTRVFGNSPDSTDHATRWNLTREYDSFGNQATYTWSRYGVSLVDFTLTRIEYTSNAAAGLVPHARVDFTYAPVEICTGSSVPIGARTDHHFGVARLFGARRLTEIVTSVRASQGSGWRTARRHTLTYDTSALECATATPPLRFLTRLGVTAYAPDGTATAAPPVTLTYGPRQRSFSPVPLGDIDHAEYGDRKGATGGLLDLDGDGLIDQVRVDVDPDDQSCRLHYRRGQRGGTFAGAETSMRLPTAPWEHGDLGPGPKERCTLGGQRFSRSPVIYGGGQWCSVDRGGFISYHFLDVDGDGVVDLLTNAWSNLWVSDETGAETLGGDFLPGFTEEDNDPTPDDSDCDTDQSCPAGAIEAGTTDDCEVVCMCPIGEVMGLNGCVDDCFPDCSSVPPNGDLPYPPCSTDAQTPEETHWQSGEYIWRYFPNQDGSFALPADPVSTRRLVSDRPLPPNGSELTTSVATTSSLPTLIDLDGDGQLDVVSLPVGADGAVLDPLGEATELEVWHGRRTPFGVPYLEDDPVTWPLPVFDHCCGNVDTTTNNTGSIEHVVTKLRATLADVDGDRLPDLVVEKSDGKLYVAWNQGSGFAAPVALGQLGPIERTQSDLSGAWGWGQELTNGRRGTPRRLLDVDADGLPDLLTLPSTPSNVAATGGRTAARNVGDRFIDSASPPSVWDAAREIFESTAGDWYRSAAVVDLSGDGAADLVTWTASGVATLQTDDTGGPPLRLLTTVDNGRGGVLRFAYAASTDGAVVDLAGGILPSPRWVVQSVTREAGAGQPASITGYRYRAPVNGVTSPSDLTPPRFLGFAQVEVQTPHPDGISVGARTVRDFDYAIGSDFSGRAVREQVFVGGAATALHDRRWTWHNVGVLDTVSFTYRAEELDYSCAAGATPEDPSHPCALLRTTETWEPHALPDDLVGLYLHRRTVQGPDLTTSSGDRATDRRYQVRTGQAPYSPTDYRVLTTRVERQRALPLAGMFGFLPMSRTLTELDALGLPERTRVSLAVNGPAAITERTFDPQTGNLLTVRRPNQVPVAGPVTTLGYDSHRIFVQHTVNELGHAVFTTTDPATGAMVRREGPDHRGATIAGCTPTPLNSCQVVVWAPETWRIDGFGRVLEHHVAAEPTTAGGGYGLQLAERVSYFESTPPNLRRSERLRDAGGAVWVTSDDRFDGRGRLVSRTDRRQVGGEPDAVTSYTYDTRGTLASMRVPDPRADSGATVEYRYRRDALARLVLFERPDRSVVRVAYAGLDVRTSESSSESPAAEIAADTTAHHNVFGEVIAVDEHDNPDLGDIATTRYTYDSAGRLTSITDADDVVTTMTHDWADRRTSITRGDRTWTYAYDLDGNLVRERSPLPAGADPVKYTSTTTHDALDRPLVHIPAAREMTPERLADLGIGAITRTYDTADNGVGRLAGVALPFGTVGYRYDVQGRPAREERTFAVSYLEDAAATQWVERRYNLLGQVTRVGWDDGTGWDVAYDARALPASMTWNQPGAPLLLASYQRSVAGAPRRRSAAADQRRDWTYDALGRVVADRVYRPSTNTSWSERSYGFDGLGELRAVSGHNHGLAADALFDYDRRHRLISAEGPVGYQGVFAYSPGGNLTRAAVSGAGDLDRDVMYEYGDVDPQAVDRLVTTGAGPVIASMGYDDSGNLTSKLDPGGEYTFDWDGDDRLREARSLGGAREVYYYDHDGQRVLAITKGEGVRFWFGESETRFPAAGGPLRRWHHLALGEPIARIEDNAKVELQYADALQNLMLALAKDGQVRAAFTYGPFGEVLASHGAADHRRQFNGKEHDAATGLRHYGFRSYDPLLLRWTSADPLYRVAPDWKPTEPQRANLYAFSGNNPVRFLDPDGLEEGEDKDEEEVQPPPVKVEVTMDKFGFGGYLEMTLTSDQPQTIGDGPLKQGVLEVNAQFGLDGPAVNVDNSAWVIGDTNGQAGAKASMFGGEVTIGLDDVDLSIYVAKIEGQVCGIGGELVGGLQVKLSENTIGFGSVAVSFDPVKTWGCMKAAGAAIVDAMGGDPGARVESFLGNPEKVEVLMETSRRLEQFARDNGMGWVVD